MQSNMALPLLHTFSRNITRIKALSGAYDIRITGLKGNMNKVHCRFRCWKVVVVVVVVVMVADKVVSVAGK